MSSISEREPRVPTLHPASWHTFAEAIKPVLQEEFQDTANFAFTGEIPEYIQYDPRVYLEREGYVLTTDDKFDKALIMERMKTVSRMISAYNVGKPKFFDRLFLHLSLDSVVQLRSHIDEWETTRTSKCPRHLWLLLQKSHTMANLAASKSEKEQAKKKLECLKQKTKEGKVVPLNVYNQAWNAVHKTAEDLGADLGSVADLVELYLLSLDQSELGETITKKLYDEDLPISVAEAQTWAQKYTTIIRKVYNDEPVTTQNKRSFVQAGLINASSAVTLPSDKRLKGSDESPSSAECQFCHLKGHSANDCFFLKTYVKEKASDVAAWVKAKRTKSKSKNAGKGGGGGRGGNGRGGGKGGGRGGGNHKGGRGKGNAKKQATAAAKCDDDNDDDALDPSFSEWFNATTAHVRIGDPHVGNHTWPSSDKSPPNFLKCIYLVDNGANVTLISNPDLIWDLEDIPSTTIRGLGQMKITRQGECMFGHAYYAPSLSFNILAQCQLDERHRVQKDSKLSSSIFVDGLLEIKRGKDKLYWMSQDQAATLYKGVYAAALHPYLPRARDLEAAWPSFMDAEKTPHREYTSPEKRRAAAVKRIHEILNHPSDAALGIIFDSGTIHGCPYSSRDVRIMRHIYGLCEACVKGKSKKPSSRLVKNCFMPYNPGEMLCIDIFFITYRNRKGTVDQIPFLMVVDAYCTAMHVKWLKSKTAHAVKNALFEVISYYNCHEWVVKVISCDRETVLATLKPVLLDVDPRISFDQRGTDQKQPHAERAIETTRSLFRTVKASCWYKPPQFLYPMIIDDIASTWNIRPNTKTCSQSPMTMIEGKKLYADQHLLVSLLDVGEFLNPLTVQMRAATDEEKEQQKNEERTATGIVIKRNYDPTGTVTVYMIESGSTVNRVKMRTPCQHTGELRRQLEALCPHPEVSEDDLITPIPKLRRSRKDRSEEERASEREQVIPLEEPSPHTAERDTIMTPLKEHQPSVDTDGYAPPQHSESERESASEQMHDDSSDRQEPLSSTQHSSTEQAPKGGRYTI
jgi:uncharacterized membrane protein YgcG